MICATYSCTDSGAAISARNSSARALGSLASVNRSNCTDSLQQAVYLPRAQLMGDGIGNQAGRANRDLLADDQTVLAQSRARRRQVDDRLDQAGQRRQSHRSLDLDDFRLPT